MRACARFLSGLKNASSTVLTAIPRELVKYQALAGVETKPGSGKFNSVQTPLHREDVEGFHPEVVDTHQQNMSA